MARRKAFSVVGITLAVAGFLWLKVSPAVAAPPQNDEVGSATVISTLLFRDFLNVTEATTAPDDPDCFGQGATVWYAFTPAQDTDIDANTFGSNYDTTLSVYTGSPGALTQAACNNDAGAGFQSQVRFTASGGQTYYFMVGSPFLPGGSPSLVFTVDVAVPPPANDDFDSAIAITGLPFTDANRDTRGATTASDDPSCIGQSATVWYSFSPSENMRVDVSTFGTNYTAAVSVYTGAQGSLNQIACAQFSASFPAVVGQTYFIMVSALPGPYPYSPLGGNLTLNVSGTPSPVNDDFDSATVIPALPFTETLDTRGATTAFDDPSPTCGGGQIATVWYSFSPTQNVRVGVTSAGSNYPTVVSVYTGERGSLAGVACGFGQVSFDAGVGTSYFVMVGSASPFAPGGTLTFSAQGLTPAPNDDFGNATAITDLPFTDNLGGLGATAAADDPVCWSSSVETVWYTFTPAQNMRLEAIASGGAFAEFVSVFTGARGSLTSVACNPNQVTFDAAANTPYFIMVGSQFAAGGATVFTLRELPRAPNDDFDNPTVVPSLPFTDTVDTRTATTAPDDPFGTFGCDVRGATVWYSFSSNQPMVVAVNTFGSSYDTTLYVFTGTRGALNLVACSTPGSVGFTAAPGTTYYLMIGGAGGDLRFNMQLIPPPANDDFANAIQIPSLPFSDFRDTRGATVADDDPTPSCGGREATVWYSFTPTEDMRVEADTFGTGYYGAVSVYTGSRGSLTEVVCSNPGPTLTPLRFDATANETYYIMVGAGLGIAPSSLSFHLTAIPPAPSNDDINSATLITDADLPFNAALDARGASTAPDDPTPFCSGARTATVWFSFTPGETMRIDADTFGSNYSANISVYTGAPGALSEVFCGFSQISFIANAGQRYFFFVASSGLSGGNLNFNVRRIPPPANDDFDSAVDITTLPFTDNRNTRAATTAGDDPNCLGQDVTVWYQFTPDQDMRVEFTTSGSNYGTTLSVYTGERGNLVQLGCTTNAFPGPSPLRLDLTAGTIYHIMIGAFSFGPPGGPATGGDLVFSVRRLNPPANDDFANATNVGQLPFTDSLSTRDADVSPDDPFPCGGRAATVWYAFTPTEPTRIEANTFGSNYDTTLAVFTGSRGALTQVACNDNAPFSFGPSQLRLELSPGQTYYLMVGAQFFFNQPGGDLVFNVNFAAPGPANDIFENATPITLPSFTDSIDTREATLAYDDPFPFCSGARDATVWYAITPAEDTRIEANTSGSNYSVVLSAYTGSRGALNQLACGVGQLGINATAGTTYFLIASSAFGGGGDLALSVQAVAPPANDDFDSAVEITSLPFTDSLNTRGATVASDDPFPFCSGEREASVWYSFTPPQTMRVEANTFGSNYATTLSVYTGSRGALSQLSCDISQLSFSAEAGTTYHIMVSMFMQFGIVGGDLVFSVDGVLPPANDDFNSAAAIDSLPFTDNRDTRGASVASDDPFPFCYGFREATVWYSVTPAQAMRIEANTLGSNYGTTLSVYTGARGALNQIACGFGQLSFAADANATYFIMAASTSNGGGDLVFSVDGVLPPANDDFDSAAAIDSLPFTDNRDTRGATTAFDDPSPSCSGAREATVWYAFTAAETVRVDLHMLGSNYSTSVAVFTGSRGALTEMACRNFPPFPDPSAGQVRFEAVGGQTYFIMVAGFGAGGALTFSADLAPAAPANDDFNSAAEITSLPFTDNRDTRGADVASDDPFPFCYGFREATVWYSLTSAQAMGLDLNTFGSSYGTTISVFTGSRGALNQIACGFSQVNFTADANATYFIMVASTSNAGGDLVFAMQVIPPPANDEFANAIPVATLPFDDNRDVRGATTSPDDPTPSCGGRSATVWYALSTTEALRIEVNSFSNYTAGLSVFTGGPGAFSEVACNFNQVRFDATPGVTYYLMVGSPFGPSGQLALQVLGFQPPANNDIASAALIPAFPFNTSLDTRGASTAPDDPFPSCGGRDATVWYSFTADHDGRVEFNTFGSYSTSLSVYSGSPGTLAEVACGGSLVRFTAVAGTTYYLMVGSFQGTGGDLVLNGQELAPPANDDIGNAVEITSLPFTDFNRDTRGATTAADDPFPSCTGSGGREATVWYALTPAEDLRVDLNIFGSDYNANLAVYTGAPGTLTEAACGGSFVSFGAVSGERYFIMVAGAPGGNLFLNAQGFAAPPNDDFDRAALIPTLPFSDNLDTSGATAASDDPTTCTNNGSVWYKFTPSENMTIEANTFGSNYDTVLSVYTGVRGALTQVPNACNDDSSGLQSRVQFNATGGATYYFLIGFCCGFGGSGGGNLVFSVKGFLPANFTVNSTADAVDANPGDGVCASGAGECTLRAAIMETNALPTDDTITLPTGTYQLTLTGAGEDAAFTGDLDITGNLTLNGAGAATTIIDGNGSVTGDRVFHITGAFTVNMSGITISGGNGNLSFAAGDGIFNANGVVTLTNSSISGNTGTGASGILNVGTMTLNNSTVSGNSTSSDGGGIYNRGILSLNGSIISGNTAGSLGGGIFNEGMLTIANSAVSGNTATAVGGGILNNFGTVNLTNSTVSGNVATGGGAGILTQGGSLMLVNSTVSANTANGGGGGIHNGSDGSVTLIGTTVAGNTTTTSSGGGMEHNSGALTIINSTFSGNSAAVGGGLSVTSGSVSLNNVTIANNTATSLGGGLFVYEGFGATINAKNTVLAGNLGPASSLDCNGTLNSQGYNLIQNTTGCTIVGDTTGDRLGVDPMLGPLQDNGGPTLTHALLAGSPAIDAGNPATPGSGGTACEATDQRGVARPIGAACDIGAFEATAHAPPKLKIKVEIDKTGLLGRSGRSATIHGTVTCSQRVPITLSGTLTQKSGKKTITGSFEITVECKGGKGRTAWSATVRPNKGRFEDGKVTVTVAASAVDPGSGKTVRATASRKVQLKKSR